MTQLQDLRSEVPYGQNYIVLSYVGPDASQKCDDHAVMFRGAFRTLEEAQEYARTMSQQCAQLDVYVAEAGKFLVLPPNVAIENTEYSDERLDNLMKGYVENQAKAKEAYDVYKNEMIANAKKPQVEDASGTSRANSPEEASTSA